MAEILIFCSAEPALFMRFFKNEGYTVAVAGTLAQAQEEIVLRPPDLVLSEWLCPDGPAEALVDWVRSQTQLACLPIVILSALWETRVRVAALRAGVDAWLSMPIDPDELLAVCQAQLAARFRRRPWTPRLPGETITPQELRVLELVAQGRSNEEIAEALTLTRRTVETYVSTLLGKAGARNRTQLAGLVLTGK